MLGSFGKGPDQKRSGVWRQVAAEVGAVYDARRHRRLDTVQLQHRDTLITLDAGPNFEGRRGTRFRAPFAN
jgi:hypothetical protein